jgi:hypothetical protein
MAPRQGLAGLIADHPGAFPYVDDGGRIAMWPVAPPTGAYRLATSPAAALDALSEGDAPLIWEHEDIPDPEELLSAIADQWQAPQGGVPLFRSAPGGGVQVNDDHPLWRELRGGQE